MDSNVKLYHIDRAGTLEEGQTIYLLDYCLLEQEIDPLLKEMVLHIKRMFPDGITNHGHYYIFDHLSDNDKIVSTLDEIIFEVVRKSKYPDKLSRFQSFFAFNKDGLASPKPSGWIEDGANVYEVTADRCERRDMSLTHGNSSISISYYANRYWTNQISENPLFEYLLKPPVRILRKISSVDDIV